jgi:adenosylcobinamide-GDP ribazoletransferase
MESIDAISKYFFLSPLVGLVIGSIAGVFGVISNLFLPSYISGFLILISIQLITGFHHLDGLLDFSDAAMARGDTKRRIEVMHDMYTGAAAVGSAVIVLTLTGLTFGSFSGWNILKVAIFAELVAKESMVLIAYLGKLPNYKGMGFFVVESMKNKHTKAFSSLLICAVIGFLLFGVSIIWILLAMGITVLILKSYANSTLDSITGDVMGATNEINRMITLIIILAII